MGFTYDVGIEQLLRHDPDIICIGETRNSYTAKMVLRASLTGHLVLTSIHAKNGKECISRLEDLGVSKQDLLSVCTAIISQRLYSNGDKKVCVYEIMDQKTLEYVIRYGKYPDQFQTLSSKIKEGIEKGYILDEQAECDMFSLS
ncbi:ATPase, T2SS/T4P/T4SS family [Holdemanella biformis]